jgi:hypothetical protein
MKPNKLDSQSHSQSHSHPLGQVDLTLNCHQIIRFHDHYRTPCTLQQCGGGGGGGTPSAIRLEIDGVAAMYLGREQVQALVQALQSWADTGVFDSNLPGKKEP